MLRINSEEAYNGLKNKLNIDDVSDEELLSSFLKTGNIDLYAALFRRYLPLMYGVCLKYLADKDASHDAVMDIFEDVLKKLPQYPVQNFKTWLSVVTKNHCLHILRKSNQTIFVKMEEAFVENEPFSLPIDKTQTEEEAEALAYCMAVLPAEQEQSIRLFFFANKSYADIVGITGFDLNKIKSYIQNGKRNLKNCLYKRLSR
ncbi:MAG: sigma-70 family RNA polymerase sigma factor [Dysgonamonadaceae bacterium]